MMDALQKDRFFKDILDFVRIPSRSSPSGGEEAAIQAEVARRMRGLGARVRTFEADDLPAFYQHPLCHGPERSYSGRPTVVGEIGPPEASALLVLAHSDTVEVNRPAEWTMDPFEGVARDGMLCGLGVGDDKWGVTSLLHIMEFFQKTAEVRPLSRRLIFATTIDEENGVCNGTLLLMLAGISAETALYLDGATMGICVGCNGGSNLDLHPVGQIDSDRLAKHADALARVAKEMSRERAGIYDQPFFRDNLVKNASVKFVMRGHGPSCVLMLHFYNPPGDDKHECAHALECAVSEALGDDLSLYTMNYRHPWFEPALISEDTPLVRYMAGAYTRITGNPARITTISKQDSFLLTNHVGIPTVSFGVGRPLDPGGTHAPDESIMAEDAWQGLLIAQRAISEWMEAAR